MVVVLSDFLAPLDLLRPKLTSLAACGHEVVIFQILDPAELNFSFNTAAMFEDLESGQKVFIDPPAARKQYLQNLESHTEALRATCQGLGISFHRLATDQPLESVLFDFLRERMQRSRRVNRFAQRAAPAPAIA
jgi:uncharacterized protein (DUF58 family)